MEPEPCRHIPASSGGGEGWSPGRDQLGVSKGATAWMHSSQRWAGRSADSGPQVGGQPGYRPRRGAERQKASCLPSLHPLAPHGHLPLAGPPQPRGQGPGWEWSLQRRAERTSDSEVRSTPTLWWGSGVTPLTDCGGLSIPQVTDVGSEAPGAESQERAPTCSLGWWSPDLSFASA